MFNCTQKCMYCNRVPWSSVLSCYTNMFDLIENQNTTQVLSADANLVMFAFCISFLFSPIDLQANGIWVTTANI